MELVYMFFICFSQSARSHLPHLPAMAALAAAVKQAASALVATPITTCSVMKRRSKKFGPYSLSASASQICSSFRCN